MFFPRWLFFATRSSWAVISSSYLWIKCASGFSWLMMQIWTFCSTWDKVRFSIAYFWAIKEESARMAPVIIMYMQKKNSAYSVTSQFWQCRTGFSFVITGRCGKHRSRPMINFVRNCSSDLPTNFRNKVSLEMNNGCIFVNSTFCSLDLTYGNGNLDTAIRSRRGHRKKMPLTELEEDRKIYTKSIKLLINFRGSRWFTN